MLLLLEVVLVVHVERVPGAVAAVVVVVLLLLPVRREEACVAAGSRLAHVQAGVLGVLGNRPARKKQNMFRKLKFLIAMFNRKHFWGKRVLCDRAPQFRWCFFSDKVEEELNKNIQS